MKKIVHLTLLFLFLSFSPLFAQGPPPPPPDAGSSSGPVGGNAPTGCGTIILLLMGIAYGIKKYSGGEEEE